MTSGKELDLVIELAKLLKKYGPDAFASLAASIKSPEFTETLADVLTSIPNISRRNKRAKSNKSAKHVDNILAIKDTEPEKYAALSKFRADLSAGIVLATMRDIKNFAADCGLPNMTQTSRKKAIGPLIKHLIPLPLEEITNKIKTASRQDVHGPSLEGWSKLILDRDRAPEE
jgi:hypothetical protein